LDASSTGSSFDCLAVIDLAATVAIVFLVVKLVGLTALVALFVAFIFTELDVVPLVVGFAAALDAISGTKRDSADTRVIAVCENRFWRLVIYSALSLAVFNSHHFICPIVCTNPNDLKQLKQI
jgi:hypothetical protein